MTMRQTLGSISCACILVFVVFSGCVLFRQTFHLVSSEILDDTGFPTLALTFNCSGTTRLSLSSPSKKVVYEEEFYKGQSSAFPHLSEYHVTPQLGTYTLQVYDRDNSSLSTQQFVFQGGNLSMASIKTAWTNEKGWGDPTTFCGINMTVKNTGDLPVYPSFMEVTIADLVTSARILPVAVLPNASAFLCSFFHVDLKTTGSQLLTIVVKDSGGAILFETVETVQPRQTSAPLDFSWTFQGEQRIVFPFPEYLFAYYRNHDRLLLNEYSAYVFDQYDDVYIDNFASLLYQKFETLNSNTDQINALASFVQSIPYAEDDPQNLSWEYPRYPVETLAENKGDCEDKAILLSALLSSIGYNVSLLRLPNHMALGVHLEKSASQHPYFIDQYFYLESTRTDWLVGEIPPEYMNQTNITVYPLTPTPLLLHTWSNATRYTIAGGADFVKLSIFIENLGSLAANDVEIRGGFFSLDHLIYNQKSMSVPSVPAHSAIEVLFTISIPKGVSTLLKTQLYMGSQKVNERESVTWFS